MFAKSQLSRLQAEATEEMPAGLAGLEEVKRVGLSSHNIEFMEGIINLNTGLRRNH